MPILRFRTRSVSALHFAITLTVLLISPLSISSQINSFSLFLDLDESVGDQAIQSAVLNVRVALQVAAAPSPDFDGSGFVDTQDYSLLIKVFGYQEGQEGYEAKYDLNGDGEIGLDDFFIFIRSYGTWVQRAPVFTSETYVTHFIDENTPGGEPIGDPISATDADGDILNYRLSGLSNKFHA